MNQNWLLQSITSAEPYRFKEVISLFIEYNPELQTIPAWNALNGSTASYAYHSSMERIHIIGNSALRTLFDAPLIKKVVYLTLKDLVGPVALTPNFFASATQIDSLIIERLSGLRVINGFQKLVYAAALVINENPLLLAVNDSALELFRGLPSYIQTSGLRFEVISNPRLQQLPRFCQFGNYTAQSYQVMAFEISGNPKLSSFFSCPGFQFRTGTLVSPITFSGDVMCCNHLTFMTQLLPQSVKDELTLSPCSGACVWQYCPCRPPIIYSNTLESTASPLPVAYPLQLPNTATGQVVWVSVYSPDTKATFLNFTCGPPSNPQYYTLSGSASGLPNSVRVARHSLAATTAITTTSPLFIRYFLVYRRFGGG